jgi:hypothetical protein
MKLSNSRSIYMLVDEANLKPEAWAIHVAWVNQAIFSRTVTW